MAYNEPSICEERREVERKFKFVRSSKLLFSETNLVLSFKKSNFASGKRWDESLLSARFFAKYYVVRRLFSGYSLFKLT